MCFVVEHKLHLSEFFDGTISTKGVDFNRRSAALRAPRSHCFLALALFSLGLLSDAHSVIILCFITHVFLLSEAFRSFQGSSETLKASLTSPQRQTKASAAGS